MLYILASRDCYIKVFYIDVTGEKSTQVFPNPYEQRNFLRGGRSLLFPGTQSAFKFRLSAPFGTEYIKVTASTSPF
ncbi:MAG: DUF4384 domain-containing protein [Spirochaetales bacterium]|nr:DUF4384 domain-containing protein [Spirochaetales bacterium]